MRTGGLLEDIKSKIDIVEFISGYVQLKKSGQNWKGLCPFHAEKTPSFMVNQSKQIFHCFGCGAGGDVIAFASKYDSISFNEAVHMLAKKAGIPFAGGKPDRKVLLKDERIRSALVEACNFYTKKLSLSDHARAYLNERGVSRESSERFQLGYAPAGWDSLLKHLRHSGYSDSIISEAGLAVSGSKGFYDMFRQRIIFPITSISGKVIAFGGRALDNATPKYINSPETAVFKKSETLFGLYTAREDIKRSNSVIIVEGYMDVLICYQYGFKNVVAPLGTSLTSGHVQKLRALADNAVLVFDGDAAGKAAARRALPLLCQNNYKARVLLLPDQEDPDSFLRKNGSGSFGELFEKAKTMVDFLFSVSDGDKIPVVREVLTLIAAVKDLLIAEEMLIDLSDRTRIHETTLREELRKIKGNVPSTIMKKHGLSQPSRNKEEYLLLSAVIAFPDKLKSVMSRLAIGDIQDKTVSALFEKLALHGDSKDLSDILGSLDEDERQIVTRFSVDPGFDPANVDGNIDDCLRKIEQRKLDERLRLAERTGDLVLISNILLEKKKFIKESGL